MNGIQKAMMMAAWMAAATLGASELAVQGSASAQEESAPAATAPTAGLAGMRLHGYLATDYKDGRLVKSKAETNDLATGFETLRFIFGIQGALAEDFFFNSEVEIEHATRVGVKTGSVNVAPPNCSTCTVKALSSASAGLEVEVEQAWLEHQRWGALKPRAGIILVPVGRLNLYHDSDLVDTVDRPLVNQQIIPTTWYEPGVGLAGDLELGFLGVHYEGYLINGLRASAANAADETKTRDLRMSKDSANDNNGNRAMAGRLALSPLLGLELGVSAYQGAWDGAGSLGLNLQSVDARYKWKMVELSGEWAQMSLERPSLSLAASDANYLAPTAAFAGLRQGWYAQLLLSSPWEFAGRWALLANVSQIDPDVQVATANDLVRETYGINYRPADNIVLKLQFAETKYGKPYVNSAGGLSPIVDQQFQSSLAASF